jgi:hypothetical protein
MSHSVAYFLGSKTNSKKLSESEIKLLKKQGYVLGSKLKKDMKVEIGINAHEDGNYNKVVTITKVNKVVDYHDSVQIEFADCDYFNELPVLPLHYYYKVEK